MKPILYIMRKFGYFNINKKWYKAGDKVQFHSQLLGDVIATIDKKGGLFIISTTNIPKERTHVKNPNITEQLNQLTIRLKTIGIIAQLEQLAQQCNHEYGIQIQRLADELKELKPEKAVKSEGDRYQTGDGRWWKRQYSHQVQTGVSYGFKFGDQIRKIP